MQSGIYIISNKITGKTYIGSSIDVYRRWGKHKINLQKNQHHSVFLQRAWNKYGADFFSFEIFEIGIKSEDLLSWEQAAFEYFKPEYNIAKFAGSQLGFKHSKETKQKLSNIFKGLGSSMYGKSKSLEHRRFLSEIHTGNKNHMFGKKISKQQKLCISKANRGEKHPLAKLTEITVKEIKLLLATKNMSQRAIAEMYGVSKDTVQKISSGKLWKHVG